MSEDIVYVQPPSGNSAENYVSNEQVQYVTPQQYEKRKYKKWINVHFEFTQSNKAYSILKKCKIKAVEYTPQPQPYAHPVHEATHTFSAPARHSLTNPIILKSTGIPSPYLAQQPKYVYVQAGPQQQVSSSGILTYGTPQHSAENSLQQQQKNAQDDINYSSVEQNNLLESSKQAPNAPARQQGYPTHSSFLQYVPYLAQQP